MEEVLAGHHVAPESDPSLKALLPAITTCFAANLSVVDIIKALKEHERSDDTSGKLSSFSRTRFSTVCYTGQLLIVLEHVVSVFTIIE